MAKNAAELLRCSSCSINHVVSDVTSLREKYDIVDAKLEKDLSEIDIGLKNVSMLIQELYSSIIEATND